MSKDLKVIIISFFIVALAVGSIWLLAERSSERGVAKREDRPFVPPKRNYERIQYEDIRKVIDPIFNQLADELSASYYDYWKKGKSHPWQGYDVQPTPEQSKELFDKLHGLIWHHYILAFHKYNLSQPMELRIPESEYNDIIDFETGKVINKRTEIALEEIEKLENEGISINAPSVP